MFEVILTYRDFTEQMVERYPTAEEARAAAEGFSSQLREHVVRAWVRQIREVKTNRP
ncbi:MAG: hypothetical protein JO112_18995 [Planctomycetes bacterium]|nr:hypothetical protein [Planctomycetota bacterium]